jgi:hypothetical protein
LAIASTTKVLVQITAKTAIPQNADNIRTIHVESTHGLSNFLWVAGSLFS